MDHQFHINKMLDKILELQKENKNLRSIISNLRLAAYMREEIIDNLKKQYENHRKSFKTTQ